MIAPAWMFGLHTRLCSGGQVKSSGSRLPGGVTWTCWGITHGSPAGISTQVSGVDAR